MKLATCLFMFVALSANAQSTFHFLVYKFEHGSKDSTLDWEYTTNNSGILLWEKHQDGEEIHYELDGNLIVKANQCFNSDSCFTYRYIYENEREIYRYNITQPAYFDSIPIKINVRTEYPDSLTRICYFKQESAERFNNTMFYRITRTGDNSQEQIAFDDNGRAYYFVYKELDKFGPVRLETAFIEEGEGRVPHATYKRYPYRSK